MSHAGRRRAQALDWAHIGRLHDAMYAELTRRPSVLDRVAREAGETPSPRVAVASPGYEDLDMTATQ